MRSDDPAAIMGTLGLIEDEMAELLPGYSEAAGWMAEYALWFRREYLQIRKELIDQGVWEKGTTETAKKDDIEYELFTRHADKMKEAEQMAHIKGHGDKLFNGQDARRSIGQSLLKRHSEVDSGQRWGGSQGQTGQPA